MDYVVCFNFVFLLIDLLQYVASGSDDFNVYVWKIPDAVYHGL